MHRYQFRLYPFAIFVGLFLAFFPALTFAGADTITSAALEIQLSANPFSYRVIERSTGDALVSQTGGTLFTDNKYSVRNASDVRSTTTSLHAILHLEGTSEAAQIRFTFIRPELVQVVLTFKNGVPAEIHEEFADQGEHYYGIWEMPFRGNIDNRGADHDFLGIRHQAEVNYSSARAPFYVTSRKYGIYVESTAKGHFTIAQAGKTSFSFFDTQLKYDVLYGPSYSDVLKRYNSIAGPAIMPPAWA